MCKQRFQSETTTISIKTYKTREMAKLRVFPCANRRQTFQADPPKIRDTAYSWMYMLLSQVNIILRDSYACNSEFGLAGPFRIQLRRYMRRVARPDFNFKFNKYLI